MEGRSPHELNVPYQQVAIRDAGFRMLQEGEKIDGTLFVTERIIKRRLIEEPCGTVRMIRDLGPFQAQRRAAANAATEIPGAPVTLRIH